MTRRDSLGAFTIATVESRVAAVSYTFFVCLCAGTWVIAANQHAPMPRVVNYLMIVAGALIGGCSRGFRLGLRIDEDGVAVRNFLRAHRFGWPEVSRFADGSAFGAESQRWWALCVILRDGRTVTARGTTRSGPPGPEVLTAIRTAAGRYGISAELTGVATRRSLPNASTQRQPSEFAPARAADGAILPESVATTRFSTTRLRPGYDLEQVDAFVQAIRATFLGVREPPLTSDDVRNKQFSTTRLRPGYDEAEVDAFLDEVETRLAASPRPTIDDLG